MPRAGRPVRHHAALLVAALAEMGSLHERFRPLIEVGMSDPSYAASMRRVLRSLPVDLRRSLVDPLAFRHGKDWCKGAWLYAEVYPMDEALSRTLAAIREGKLPLPEERAIAILTSFGRDALPALREAEANLEDERAELVAKARCILENG